MNRNSTPAMIFVTIVLMVWLWVVTQVRVITFEDASQAVQWQGQTVAGWCPDLFTRLQCSD